MPIVVSQPVEAPFHSLPGKLLLLEQLESGLLSFTFRGEHAHFCPLPGEQNPEESLTSHSPSTAWLPASRPGQGAGPEHQRLSHCVPLACT